MKLSHVLKAHIALVAVHTNDVTNASSILSHAISSKSKKKSFLSIPAVNDISKIPGMIQEYGLMTCPPDDLDYNKLYTSLNDADKVLILVNPDFKHDMIYEYGWLDTPEDLLKKRLSEMLADVEMVDLFVPVLKDLSLKQAEDVLRLASSVYGEISADTLSKIKREYTKLSTGLHMVDADMKFYYPIGPIETWIIEQGSILKKDVPRELKPRGLLFNGAAGTGKTFSAKRIAQSQGVPLYRLDVSALKAKYVGDSERNMSAALKKLEVLSPCVLLIDEIEKLFGGDDSNVSSGLLSQLLWWLQEHQLDVLTVMTTNDKHALPQELYRPGRINCEVFFEAMSLKDAKSFVQTLVSKYTDILEFPQTVIADVFDVINKMEVSKGTYANLTEVVFSEIRKQLK